MIRTTIRTTCWALIALALGTAGCGGSHGSKSGMGGTPYPSTGKTAVLLTDGPIQVVNDNRTIITLEIDITRVTLESAGNEESGGNDGVDGGAVVVFDTARGDNGGNPMTVDLLALTDSSTLLGLLNVPVGTYDEARLTVSAARAEFEDTPGVLVALVLGSEGEGPAGRFEFEFDPPVTVTADGTTVASIDFVPVVTKVGDDYVLTHDHISDQSGEEGENAGVHFTGAITSVSDDFNTIMVEGVSEAIDVSAAAIEADDMAVDKTSLAVGQRVKVEGMLDASLGTIVATEVEILDSEEGGESADAGSDRSDSSDIR